MVVMSFLVEHLAPVARAVNGIVHQMHGSDVTLQIISRSILVCRHPDYASYAAGLHHPLGRVSRFGWGAGPVHCLFDPMPQLGALSPPRRSTALERPSGRVVRPGLSSWAAR